MKKSSINRNGLLYGLGAIGLGLVGIAFGDFALQWQPVAKDVPMRTTLAYASAAAMVVAGGLALVRRTASWGLLLLATLYALWTLGLHGPRVIAAPMDAGLRNAFCEIAALSAAGFALCAAPRGGSRNETIVLFARIAFGVCAVVFGSSHLLFPAFTASFVPAWIPFPLFWAYATGAGHAASGIALISGVQARLAVTMHALMMGSFVILLHLPRVFAQPASHVEWTMLAIASSLTGAAWAMSQALRIRLHEQQSMEGNRI